MPNNSYGQPIRHSGSSHGNNGLTVNGHSISYSATYGAAPDPTPDPYDTPNLPELVVVTSDEHDNVVRMTLSPEPNISNGELVKLFMFVTAMNFAPNSFNALAHVKKNSLERHFTYS